MILMKDTTQIRIEDNTAVAIGKFDGLHLGHRLLIDELNKTRENGLKTAIFTFTPSPTVFFGLGDGKELMSISEKRDAFEKLGIDYLVEYPFDKKTAAISPEEYVEDFLINRMHAKFIAAGEDVSFGDKGKGDAALLKKIAAEHGVCVRIIPKLCYKQTEISSSLVRQQVAKGNMELVKKLLGEPYSVSGKVLHGKKLGRTLGLPTLNIRPDQSKLLPPNGVYFSTVYMKQEQKTYFGVSNIGYKPTVEDEKVLGIETFLFDFDREIYGSEICVFLHCFDRPECTFAGLKELKAAIEQNVNRAKRYFGLP